MICCVDCTKNALKKLSVIVVAAQIEFIIFAGMQLSQRALFLSGIKIFPWLVAVITWAVENKLVFDLAIKFLILSTVEISAEETVPRMSDRLVETNEIVRVGIVENASTYVFAWVKMFSAMS